MNKDYLIQLTQNLYHLTLLFPKKEPLRYKMREIADEILANSLRITNYYEYTNKKPEKTDYNPPSAFPSAQPLQVLDKLEVLDGFFEVAKSQNWVSPVEILKIQEEYNRIKDEIKKIPKQLSGTKRVEPLQKGTGEGQSLNVRQEKILEILKERGKAQVGELKEVFPEVSKRTLRRDFQFLLKKGKIERIGERNNIFYQLKGRTQCPTVEGFNC